MREQVHAFGTLFLFEFYLAAVADLDVFLGLGFREQPGCRICPELGTPVVPFSLFSLGVSLFKAEQ